MSDFKKQYQSQCCSRKVCFIAAFALLIMVILLALKYGAESFTWRQIWLSMNGSSSEPSLSILKEIRGPRVLAAIFVGAALGASGVIMQGVTQNPLADPGLLGINAGAQLFLVLAMIGTTGFGVFEYTLMGIVGAGFGAGLVLNLGRVHLGGMSPVRLVLAGAAVSAFLYAIAEGLGLIFKLTKSVSMWQSDGLMGLGMSNAILSSGFIICGLLFAMIKAPDLTILNLGEEIAIGLGQSVDRIKGYYFVVNIVLAGTATALAGSISFVGLVIPHLARRLVGTDFRYLLPMAMLCGSIFFTTADLLARVMAKPYEIPLMAVIALLGLPAVALIIRKGQSRGYQ